MNVKSLKRWEGKKLGTMLLADFSRRKKFGTRLLADCGRKTDEEPCHKQTLLKE